MIPELGQIALLLALAGLGLTACSVNEVITADETELIVAETPPDESMLLDIGIVQFDAGVPEDNDPSDTRIYAEIRSAEARYLRLRDHFLSMATADTDVRPQTTGSVPPPTRRLHHDVSLTHTLRLSRMSIKIAHGTK